LTPLHQILVAGLGKVRAVQLDPGEGEEQEDSREGRGRPGEATEHAGPNGRTACSLERRLPGLRPTLSARARATGRCPGGEPREAHRAGEPESAGEALLFPGMAVTSESEIEEQLRDALRHAPPEIVCAYLFGSVARGEARRASDVDVGVLYASLPEPRLDAGPLDLEGTLEKALRRPVQLVVLNRAPADLVHRVLRDGRLLLERDRAARIRFEVAKRNEYFDLEPLRRRYRRRDRHPS